MLACYQEQYKILHQKITILCIFEGLLISSAMLLIFSSTRKKSFRKNYLPCACKILTNYICQTHTSSVSGVPGSHLTGSPGKIHLNIHDDPSLLYWEEEKILVSNCWMLFSTNSMQLFWHNARNRAIRKGVCFWNLRLASWKHRWQFKGKICK